MISNVFTGATPPVVGLFGLEFNTEQTFTYTNYRGEVAERKAIFRRLTWGSDEYHPEPQWLLIAWDCVKDDWRTFALKDIHIPGRT